MDVVVLGKARYSKRPSFAKFLADGPARGHSVQLLDRKDFLELPLTQDVVVLAKSHYHDPKVRQRLDQARVRVINSVQATDLCRSRRGVAAKLRAAELATPAFLEPGGPAPPLPWIVKPDRGADHDLMLVSEHRAVDPASEFVQHFVLAARTLKIYVVGKCQHGVELIPKDPTVLDPKPLRRDDFQLDASARDLAIAAAKVLDLDVFNIDMVLCDGMWQIVDVNPFPRLEPFPDAASALWDLVETEMNPRRASVGS